MSIDELQIIHSGWAQRVQKLSGVEFFDPQRLSRTHRQAIDVAPIKPHINDKMWAVGPMACQRLTLALGLPPAFWTMEQRSV